MSSRPKRIKVTEKKEESVTGEEAMEAADIIIRLVGVKTAIPDFDGLCLSCNDMAELRTEAFRTLKKYLAQNPLKLEVDEIPRNMPEARTPIQILYLKFDWIAYRKFKKETNSKRQIVVLADLHQFVIKVGQTCRTLADRASNETPFEYHAIAGAGYHEILRVKAVTEAIAMEIIAHNFFSKHFNLRAHRAGISALNRGEIMKKATELSEDEQTKSTVVKKINDMLSSILQDGYLVDEPEDFYICPFCTEKIQLFGSYQVHCLRLHTENPVEYVCPRGLLCKSFAYHKGVYTTFDYRSFVQHGRADCTFKVKEKFDRMRH